MIILVVPSLPLPRPPSHEGDRWPWFASAMGSHFLVPFCGWIARRVTFLAFGYGTVRIEVTVRRNLQIFGRQPIMCGTREDTRAILLLLATSRSSGKLHCSRRHTSRVCVFFYQSWCLAIFPVSYSLRTGLGIGTKVASLKFTRSSHFLTERTLHRLVVSLALSFSWQRRTSGALDKGS